MLVKHWYNISRKIYFNKKYKTLRYKSNMKIISLTVPDVHNDEGTSYLMKHYFRLRITPLFIIKV